MSMIKLIQRPEAPAEVDTDEEPDIKIAKTPIELQRMKLEKLTKNIHKPVPIPKSKKEHKPAPPPEFVRNVVGSSAGAGSGEYHIYRNLRKKEYARREYYEQQARQEALDKEYEDRVNEKKRKLDEKLAKKRAKRAKRKQNLKNQKKNQQKESSSDESSDESSGSEHSESAKKLNEDSNSVPTESLRP